jgi:UDP-N-acetyl-D-mannosaminuronic acid dehydrogenase
MTATRNGYEVAVVGGAGHVGAPLCITLARRGWRTLAYDLNRAALEQMARGELGFMEEDGADYLREVLAAGTLGVASSPELLRDVSYVVITIGTPVDEFHNPVLRLVTDCVTNLLPHLRDGQTLVLRSTVFPGVTEFLHRYLREQGRDLLVAFCPERVVQGYAIREIQNLPQIVSGTTPEAEESAARLFGGVAPRLVRMKPAEAEFCKLVCNAYRYIQFAAANQFYMMAEAAGLDFARVLEGLKRDYPRMRDFPRPGFTAGPCLYKDTLQLAAFDRNHFALGLEAIQVNEGLPAYLLDQVAARHPIDQMTVGLLGMAFKAESDDNRSSLSYKLKKLLRVRARRVLTTDPYVRHDPELRPLDEVVAASDLLIVCTPHAAYHRLDLRGKPVVDIWHCLPEQGAVESSRRSAA